MSTSSIAFIGNPTSISFLVGQELQARGYEVEIIGNGSIFQTNNLSKKPSLAHRAIRKYCKPLYQNTINKKEYDIELRSFSKPIVKAKHRAVVYHGNDLRDQLWPIEYPCFYSTVELGTRYLDLSRKDAVWLPRCIYSDIFKPANRVPFDGKHITIGHFPTDPKMDDRGWQGKGSSYLYAAIEVLKARGMEVELLTPETMGHVSHDEMPELYKRCHVIADQFKVGQYGVISLEAILMNRPTVCYIPPENWEYEAMKSQIQNCTQEPESIADALVKAIDRPVNPELILDLYSPRRSADIMEKALISWGFLN